MKTTNIIVTVAVLTLVALIIYPNINGKAVKTRETVFNGVITNMEVPTGVYLGEGVYDRSCNSIENGLTQCDAGIQTEKGLLNFNYKHNMIVDPCIDPGDKLEVEVLDSEGNALVRRLK